MRPKLAFTMVAVTLGLIPLQGEAVEIPLGGTVAMRMHGKTMGETPDLVSLRCDCSFDIPEQGWLYNLRLFSGTYRVRQTGDDPPHDSGLRLVSGRVRDTDRDIVALIPLQKVPTRNTGLTDLRIVPVDDYQLRDNLYFAEAGFSRSDAELVVRLKAFSLLARSSMLASPEDGRHGPATDVLMSLAATLSSFPTRATDLLFKELHYYRDRRFDEDGRFLQAYFAFLSRVLADPSLDGRAVYVNGQTSPIREHALSEMLEIINKAPYAIMPAVDKISERLVDDMYDSDSNDEFQTSACLQLSVAALFRTARESAALDRMAFERAGLQTQRAADCAVILMDTREAEGAQNYVCAAYYAQIGTPMYQLNKSFREIYDAFSHEWEAEITRWTMPRIKASGSLSLRLVVLLGYKSDDLDEGECS